MKTNLVGYCALIVSVVLAIWLVVISSRLDVVNDRLDQHYSEIQKLRKEADYNAEWRSMASPSLLKSR